MLVFAFCIFGLIVGSFLNVLILRYPERSLGGRSACMQCGRQIVWYDNVPLISFVLLGGRCRFCHTRISIQYPLVETATALLFAVVAASPVSFAAQLIALPVIALLIAITVYDLYHTIIPDLWVYSFAAFSFVALFITPTGTSLLWALLAGPLVALPLFLLWLVSRGTWMGFGDSKLMLGVGWLLGLANGFSALFLAFIAGGAFGAALLLYSQWGKSRNGSNAGYTMKSEIPFGPFLTAGCLLVWLAGLYGISLPFPWTVYLNQ